MPLGTYTARIDWDNDGTFTGVREDVSVFTRQVVTDRGRDFASHLTGRSVSGVCVLTLDNRGGTFSPFNSSSTLNGSLLPNRKISIQAADPLNNDFNSGFETDLSGWTEVIDPDFTATTSRVTSQAHGGSASLEIDVTATTGPGNAQRFIDFNAAPGQVWDFSVWVKGDHFDASTRSQVQIQWLDSSDSVISSAAVNNTDTSGSFVQVSLSNQTAPANTVKVRVRLMIVVLQGGDTAKAWFDTIEATGVISDLWTGYVSAIIPQPDVRGDSTVLIEGVGPLGQLNQRQVEIPMLADVRTDAAIGTILDKAGWDSTARSLGTGQTTLTRYWADRQHVMNALRQVEVSEAGFISESADGKIVFDSRHARLGSSGQSSQATFTDSSTGTLPYSAIREEDSLPQVFNIFSADVQIYSTGATGTLWKLQETGTASPKVEAGETKEFWARYPNDATTNVTAFAVDSWVTPAATTDFVANSESTGGGTNLTSNFATAVDKFAQAMKITLENTGSVDAFVTNLQARGVPVNKLDQVTVRVEDGTSQTTYGERSWLSPARFIPDSQEALDWGRFHRAIYKDPQPILAMTFPAHKSHAHLYQAFTRDVDDRITVGATGSAGLGFTKDFFIEHVHHEVSSRREHMVTWMLSDATQFSDFWVVGFSEVGTSTRPAY